jgi:3-dehydrotetronate 4-kinase
MTLTAITNQEGSILGCIADDFTGATDLANNLARGGMRTVVTVGTPGAQEVIEADAVVVALKSRTIVAAEAVAQSLTACRWLRERGARQIYFKVCSTFDSTPRGNIGPVMEALMDELGCTYTVTALAFPEAERLVFKGYLFVGEGLLSESGMRNHPLTPMTDANLVRVLQAQLSPERGRRVGLIDYRITGQSADAILRRSEELRSQGISIGIADAIGDDDLKRLAEALQGEPLFTAGSGLGIALPSVWGFHSSPESCQLPTAQGREAIISGSCSNATNAQVAEFIRGDGAAYSFDPQRLAVNVAHEVEEALAWAERSWSEDSSRRLLMYSTAEAVSVRSVQAQLGVERAGMLVEKAVAAVTQELVKRGVGKLVIAGGETAGVCVRALGIRKLRIGRQIDPGVPWCYAESPLSVTGGQHIALKSGNFGREDFFTRAFTLLA